MQTSLPSAPSARFGAQRGVLRARRLSLAAFVLPTLLAPVVVTSTARAQATAVLTAAEATPLERALDSVSQDKLRADLYFLASDEMRGRDTPSPEQRIAARYIRARLQHLGFQPGGREGSFFHEYRLPQMGLDLAATKAALTIGERTVPLAWAQDYYIGERAFGKRDVEGPVIWGGTLETADLEGVEVNGVWVLGRPTDRVPSRQALRRLEEGGALGLVVLPFGDVERQVEQLARANKNYERVRLSMGPRGGRGGEARPVFPVLHLAQRAGDLVTESLPADVQPGAKLALTLHESCDWGEREDAVLENVCGFWPGSDPKLKDEVILISAHYDHVGARDDGRIFNGADDNASGTTGLLAVAEALKAYGPMRRSVMLIWVSGEEKGLLGSAAWTKDPTLPAGTKALCNVNIDMIGRNAPDQLLITPTQQHPAYSLLTKTAEKHAASEGFTRLGSADEYWRRSDHMNFADNLKVPVAFLFTDVHEDYHQPSDTPDKIDYDKASRIVRLVVRMLNDLQVDQPEF
jgi:hypothetical protein